MLVVKRYVLAFVVSLSVSGFVFPIANSARVGYNVYVVKGSKAKDYKR